MRLPDSLSDWLFQWRRSLLLIGARLRSNEAWPLSIFLWWVVICHWVAKDEGPKQVKRAFFAGPRHGKIVYNQSRKENFTMLLFVRWAEQWCTCWCFEWPTSWWLPLQGLSNPLRSIEADCEGRIVAQRLCKGRFFLNDREKSDCFQIGHCEEASLNLNTMKLLAVLVSSL